MIKIFRRKNNRIVKQAVNIHTGLLDIEDGVTKLLRNIFTVYQLTQNNIPEDLDLRV